MIFCRLSFYGATWAIICKLGFICNDWTYAYFWNHVHTGSFFLTLVGTDLVVTKLSNKICTCYAIKSMVVRNVGSPYWHQRSNDVSFLRIYTTNQYVSLAGFTGQIHPSTGVNAVLRILGILSSLSDIENVTYMNFQLANTSNWNTCPMISERLDIWPKAK